MGIKENLRAVQEKIASAAMAAGRDPAKVKLVAVSKTHPAEAVSEAIACGHRIFGENRVQEGVSKFTGLRPGAPDIELHLIGPLQTNKAMDAVLAFDVIQTLDRPKLATAIAAAMAKTGKRPRLYVEVNIGCEPQKSGVHPKDLSAFIEQCRRGEGLEISGLMCIPPQSEPAAPHFRAMKELAAVNGLQALSMGMSADFGEAIACGATEVRVGTAIFGERRSGTAFRE